MDVGEWIMENKLLEENVVPCGSYLWSTFILVQSKVVTCHREFFSGIEFRYIQINKAQKNDATEIGGHLRKNIFVTKIPDGHCRACAVNKLHLLPKIPWDTLIVFTCEKRRMLG